MIQSLPVIKQVREWQYEREARASFDDVGGSYTWTHGNTTRTWKDADDLIAEARNGSWQAGAALNRLRYVRDTREEYASYQRRARSGDLFALGQYYHSAILLGERQDSTEAGTLLQHHPSATARSLVIFRNPDFDWTSRESQLITAEAARENYRYPTMREDDYRRLSESNREYLESVRQKVAEGDADAQWVLDQLAIRPVWHPSAQ
ncbi:MAG: hypothetical protein O3C45_06215 [Bacteroidetes bacterium]|nr:hypothetical protein [Bacteroidota bacterium]